MIHLFKVLPLFISSSPAAIQLTKSVGGKRIPQRIAHTHSLVPVPHIASLTTTEEWHIPRRKSIYLLLRYQFHSKRVSLPGRRWSSSRDLLYTRCCCSCWCCHSIQYHSRPSPSSPIIKLHFATACHCHHHPPPERNIRYRHLGCGLLVILIVVAALNIRQPGNDERVKMLAIRLKCEICQFSRCEMFTSSSITMSVSGRHSSGGCGMLIILWWNAGHCVSVGMSDMSASSQFVTVL